MQIGEDIEARGRNGVARALCRREVQLSKGKTRTWRVRCKLSWRLPPTTVVTAATSSATKMEGTGPVRLPPRWRRRTLITGSDAGWFQRHRDGMPCSSTKRTVAVPRCVRDGAIGLCAAGRERLLQVINFAPWRRVAA